MLDELTKLIGNLIPRSLNSWQATLWIFLLLILIGGMLRNLVSRKVIVLATPDDTFKQIKNLLLPRKWDSWQTMIWISLFSWAVSLLAGNLVQNIIASISWIFLIIGIHWGLHTDKAKKQLTIGKGDKEFSLIPWITGFLVSIFLFGTATDRLPSAVFVSWGPISAIIASLPKFIKLGPTWEAPDPKGRQEIVILILANVVLGCWLQLYFVSQTWFTQYSALVGSDRPTPTPTIAISPVTNEVARSQAVTLLEQAESRVVATLSGESWARVERWLLDVNQQVGFLDNAIKQQSIVTPTVPLRLAGKVLPGKEYVLQLSAVRAGEPTENSESFLTKTCQITKLSPRATAQTSKVRSSTTQSSASDASRQTATVKCGEIEDPIKQPQQPIR